MNALNPGLYIVATPIGHLDDVTQRALRVLAEVELVVAEDTRVTRRLLAHYAINATLLSLGQHNESASTKRAIEALQQGQRVALVSDAGTPLLSDPGFELVRAARASDIAVMPVPGASAITAALSACGLPTQPFWFEGFLPARQEARRSRLNELATLQATLVFFEAPHRVRPSLGDMVSELGGERQAAFARELTKLHEEIASGTLLQLCQRFEQRAPRGEFVVMVEGAQDVNIDDEQLSRLLAPLLDELPLRQAVALAVRISGRGRNDVYAQALAMQHTR